MVGFLSLKSSTRAWCSLGNMEEPEHVAKGWKAADGHIYHFAQVDPSWAEEKLGDQQHLIYAVEIIRRTSADNEAAKTFHLTFYAFGFQAALAMAAQAQIEPNCDTVLTIREGSAEEYLRWRAMYEHAKDAGSDETLSEEAVAELVRRSDEGDA